MDVYTQPELKGTQIAWEMYLWTEEMATRVARENHKPNVDVVWVWHDDKSLVQHYTQRGFRLVPGSVYLCRSLTDALPPTQIANGFTIRSCMGEAEVAERARAQYGSFDSTAPFERYVERFANFMRSPVYNPDLDIVAAASDGRIGAFCIVWPDPVNRVGHFEPVGTHPGFQRKGLGRAVMSEGLRRLKAAGMETADVVTPQDNLTAIKFYEAMGFQLVNKLGIYQKDV
jgi:ribosomal protein S18 acetylase RimI-like enzyme